VLLTYTLSYTFSQSHIHLLTPSHTPSHTLTYTLSYTLSQAGDADGTEGEGHDRDNIALPKGQMELLETVVKATAGTGKPLVVETPSHAPSHLLLQVQASLW
jgi:hypothetical protein